MEEGKRKKKGERKRGKDYWAIICAYKATNIFTSSVHKGMLVISVCDRCAGRQNFLEDKEAQVGIKNVH